MRLGRPPVLAFERHVQRLGASTSHARELRSWTSGDSNALFEGLAPEGLDDLAQHALLRHYGAGEAVCPTGDVGSSLYVVHRGLLHVLGADDGPVVARQRPGDVLGEAALLTGEPRSATVLARVPSDVVELPVTPFWPWPSGTPSCWRTWLAAGLTAEQVEQTLRRSFYDVVVESLELASLGAAELQFGPGTWRDMRHAERYLAAGEAAMAAALPALRALARPTCPQSGR